MNKEFPENWKSFDLEDICFFQEGPGLRQFQYREKGTKFINIRCIKDGYLDTSIAQFISSDEVENKYKHFLLNDGDYVLSSSGSIGRIAVVRRYDLPLLLNTSVIRFRTLDESILDMKYLFYFLQSEQFFGKIFEQSQGSAQVNFGPSHLKLLNVSVPPLHEQKKIAEVLGSFDNIIYLLSKQVSKYDLLLKGLTMELTSKNEETDNDVNSIIDQEVNFQGGSQPPRSTFKFRPGKNLVRLLQIRDYKSDKNATYIPKEFSKRWCSKTDVMIGRYGPPNFQILRGKDGSYNVALIKATPKSDKRLNNEYLYRFLTRYDLFEIIDKLSQRTSGQQGLDMNALRLFPLPLKPLEDQIKIARMLQEFEDYKNKLVAKRKKYIFLKNALMNDFLTGCKKYKVL